MELVEAMLEETSSHSQALAREIAGSLDLAAIYDTIGDFYELMQDREVKQAGFDDEAERGLFRAYHILKHLQDYQINLGLWGEGGREEGGGGEEGEGGGRGRGRGRRREREREGEEKGEEGRSIYHIYKYHSPPLKAMFSEIHTTIMIFILIFRNRSLKNAYRKLTRVRIAASCRFTVVGVPSELWLDVEEAMRSNSS